MRHGLRDWADLPGTMRIVVVIGSFVALSSYVFWPMQFGADRYPEVLAVTIIVAAATFGLAGLVGMIFAVPRVMPTGWEHRSLSPNTNLEQISDWLTKILVGAGLVQLSTAPAALRRLSEFLAPSLGGTPAAQGFGAAVVVFNCACGFAVGYITTRTILAVEFEVDSAPTEASPVRAAPSRTPGDD